MVSMRRVSPKLQQSCSCSEPLPYKTVSGLPNKVFNVEYFNVSLALALGQLPILPPSDHRFQPYILTRE